MKRFVRRQAADDRQLKLIARADQRKADLRRAAMTKVSESSEFHARAMTDEQRSIARRISSPDRGWRLT